MDLARFAIEKRIVSALATLLVLFAGYFAYSALPRFEDPEFIIRQAQVITPYAGASAEEVAQEVTDVVEDALQQLTGVKEIKSKSFAGRSEVTIEFEIVTTRTRDALSARFAQLRAKVSDATPRLPPNAGPPQVYDDFGDVYAQYYLLTGEDFDLAELSEYAKSLQKDLVLVDGVSKVRLLGAPRELIYIDFAPRQLAQLGLSADRLASLIEGQSLVTSARTVDVGDQRVEVRVPAAFDSVRAIAELVIPGDADGRVFRLRDVATVRRGFEEPAGTRLFHDGAPAIGIGISNELGGNVVEMGDAVRFAIAALESSRPLGMDLHFVSDQSASVRASVDDFVVNVVLALVIVVGTLLVFMGLRSGLLMGGILLVTIAGTLFGMYLFGLDMQRISLGALIIALGMLVDNAIVVVEGTLVRVQRGEAPAKAASSVVQRTRWPLLGGTVVGILAFSPVGFSPDNTGEYAGSLFWTLTIALLFSWLVAVWLTPWYCVVMLRAKPGDDGKAERESFALRGYRALLRRALAVRWLALAAVFALLAVAIASFRFVPEGFFPASTRAQFAIDFNLPEGTAVGRTQQDVAELATWVRELDGVAGTNTVVGGGHLRFMLTYSAESASSAYGQILIDVEDWRRIDALRPEIQAHIDATYPDALAKVWKFVLGPGGGSLIEARYTGPDAGELRDLAEQAKGVLSAAGAVAVKDDWGEQVKVIEPRLDGARARRLGLSQADVARAIAAAYDGTVVGVYREADELRQIVMRPRATFRDDPADLASVRVFSSVSGQFVPVSEVVSGFDVVFANARVNRLDRALAITAQADPPPGAQLSSLFETVRGDIEAIELPVGYALEWRGQFGSSTDANAGLASTMPIGFGAMVVVVILLFNALRQPLIIWLTVPLAIIGVVFGLLATRTPLEFVAILAVLSLTGMLIKNAIVLIDETDSQIDEGKAAFEAIVDAAVSRVRPVGLGVLTTVLGVVPLLWDPFFKSLAIVIIAGLSFATVLTLAVVPTLYAVFFRVSSPVPPAPSVSD